MATESCTISVLDANGAAIEGATVTLDTASGSTDASGLVRVTVPASNSHTLNVSHPYYVSERVEFRGALNTGEWNNALLQRSGTSKTLLTIRLGWITVAPTAEKPESEVT